MGSRAKPLGIENVRKEQPHSVGSDSPWQTSAKKAGSFRLRWTLSVVLLKTASKWPEDRSRAASRSQEEALLHEPGRVPGGRCHSRPGAGDGRAASVRAGPCSNTRISPVLEAHVLVLPSNSPKLSQSFLNQRRSNDEDKEGEREAATNRICQGTASQIVTKRRDRAHPVRKQFRVRWRG